MIPHWRRKFITLWTGQALSILSSMISQFALTWYLTEKTGSTAVLSLSMLAMMLPMALLSPFTGSFADRFDRRFIMAISDGAIGLISLLLVALASQGELALLPILAVMLLRSVGSAFHSPC
ncbi:MAG: MFS transporter, partial [Syntrophobacteraceae bacterium]